MDTVALSGSQRAVTQEGPRKRFLGELLVKEGLIAEFELEAALRVQRERPDVFLGQILVDQKVISQRELNLVLDRFQKRYQLGNILVENQAITESQLEIALDHQRKTGLRLGDALLQLNFVSEPELKHALCTQLGVTFVDLDKLIIDRSLALVISKEYAQRHRLIPIARTDQSVTVAIGDPTDAALVDELEATIGCRVNMVTSTDASFQRAFTRAYGESPEVGLTRQHAEMGQAYQALTREHEASLSAIGALRGAQAALLQEREANTRLLAEQRTRNEWNTHVLTEIQAAHEALRAEHEQTLAALAELRREHGATCAALAALRVEQDDGGAGRVELQAARQTLVQERDDRVRRLAEQRVRNEGNERTLAELRTAQDGLRREAEEGADALRVLRARHADTIRALTELETAHDALRQEHETTMQALRERSDATLTRQQDTIGQLEAVLRRLRD